MGFLDLFSVKREKRRLNIPRAPMSRSDKLPKLPEFPAFADDLEMFERKQVKKQEKELSERDHLELGNPLFIDVNLYRAMMDEIMQTNILLKENAAVSERLNEYIGDCEKEYSKFRTQLEDLQRKLIYADRKLFS